MPSLGLSLGLPFGRAPSSGIPALDLSGLNVLAYYDFATAASLWQDSSRTVPAVVDGELIGVTDLSGSGNHAFFTGEGGIWKGDYVNQPQGRNGPVSASPVYTGCLRIPDLPFHSRALGVHFLWRPVARQGSANNSAWIFSEYTPTLAIAQHILNPTVANGASQFAVPTMSTWDNTVPIHSDRMAWSLKFGASSVKSFRDGTLLTRAFVPNVSTSTGMSLFPSNSSSFNQGWMGYEMRAIVITDAAESDARIQQLHTDFQTQWSGLSSTKGTNYFIAGDSIAVGYGADNLPHWRQVCDTNPTIRPWLGASLGTAVSGYRLGGLQAMNAPEASMPTMDHVIFCGGFNDCNYSYSAADIQTDIASWITNYAGSNYTICTIAPEFLLSGAKLTVKNTVNAWIRSTYGANVLDLDTVGIVANSSSDDFFMPDWGTRDTVHLSAQGHYKVAVALASHLGLTAPAAL